MKISKFISGKRDRKKHWESAYRKNPPNALGWYQPNPEMSLRLIGATGAGVDSRIIDVGGGTSRLIASLIDQGYRHLTVLDLSGSSLEIAREQLGQVSRKVSWIEADVTNFEFAETYDIWHDRAVFHFLTDTQDRSGYISSLRRALKPNGHLIISTFGIDGPKKCSGLKIVRYSPQTLHNELGDMFEMVDTFDEAHTTPSGLKQSFIYCHFIRTK